MTLVPLVLWSKKICKRNPLVPLGLWSKNMQKKPSGLSGTLV